MLKVSFVGLGAMAAPLYASLIESGYEVYGYDIFEAAVQRFEASGGRGVDSPAAAADTSDLLLSLLPYAEDVEAAMLGEQGVCRTLNKDVVVVECSTIDVGCAKEIQIELAKVGIRMLDGGIACSPRMAKSRRGSLLLGGDEEVLECIKDPLHCMFLNGSVTLCGPIGSGKIMKLVNNYVGGIQVVAISEAFHLAKRAGVNLKIAHKAMTAGMANCWALKIRPPYSDIVESCPANEDYIADFSVDYEAKDMAYAIKSAEQLGSSTAFGSVALQYYKTAQNWGEGKKDFSFVIKVVEALSGE